MFQHVASVSPISKLPYRRCYSRMLVSGAMVAVWEVVLSDCGTDHIVFKGRPRAVVSVSTNAASGAMVTGGRAVTFVQWNSPLH
jgi:hypothetical protein